MSEAGGLFVGVDRAVLVAAFARRLRQANLPAPLSAIERAGRAMDLAGPSTRQDLYWLFRLSFVSDRTQLPLFDRVFDSVFHRELDRNEHRANVRGDNGAISSGGHERPVSVDVDRPATEGAGLPWATRPAVVSVDEGDPDDDGELAIPELVAGVEPGLADRPFDDLDPEELAHITRHLETLSPSWPRRRNRRRKAGRSGSKPELRLAMRRAMRTGGETLQLPRSRPRTTGRPIVLLLDVSGSMEAYATAYLHLARALAVGGRAEVFAFATTITRITPSLRLRSPAEAIERASDDVGDRFGGTRMAASLTDLLKHRSWSSKLRGAVVVVVSDGWDTDSPEQLERRMARVNRLAHQVVWVNPRLSAEGYEPSVGGMAAALPHCDHFLPGHSLTAVGDVLTTIGSG